MKKNLSIVVSFIITLGISTSLVAQNIGINATGAAPDASAGLDINFTNKGVLVPRVALTAANLVGPIAAPAVSLLIYNTATAGAAPNNVTPGYYYWNGTRWIAVGGSGGLDWSLTGNTGTTVGTNFMGTIDNNAVAFRSNNLERMRILNDGRIAVNSIAPFATSTFYSLATGNNNAVDGNAAGTGDAIYGQNTGTGSGVTGLSTNATGQGVRAYNTDVNGTGLLASGNNAAAGYAAAGSGGAFTGTRIGVYSVSLNTNAGTSSSGVIGRDAGGTFTMLNGGAGVTGVGGNTGVGMFAYNSGTGNGLYALNNNATSFSISSRNLNASGTSIIASGNGILGNYLVGGSGLAATGTSIGIYGRGNNNANGTAGGYFVNGTGHFAYVAARGGGAIGGTNGTNYKIIGNGTVSTIVKNTKNESVTMFCPESPEVLFQDFGRGQLVNGKAIIQLDEVFSKNIYVDEKRPLRVFIQLEGNCKGVYVANKTKEGFEVIELDGGQSNVNFSYFVSANRADDYDENGNLISNFAKIRFPEAPEMLETKTIEATKIEIIEEKTLSSPIKK